MCDREVIRIDGGSDAPTSLYPVDVYDLNNPVALGAAAGFYFHIPLHPETGAIVQPEDDVVTLVGPHETREAALHAGRAFIIDALSVRQNSQEAA